MQNTKKMQVVYPLYYWRYTGMALLQQQLQYYRDWSNTVTSQRERRIVSTTVAQVITVIAVETWRWYDFDMMSWSHMDVMSMSHRHRMFTKLNLYPVILPKLNLLTAILKRFYLIVWSNILQNSNFSECLYSCFVFLLFSLESIFLK